MPKPPPHGPIGHSHRTLDDALREEFERRQRRCAAIERAIGWALIGFAIGYCMGSWANAV